MQLNKGGFSLSTGWGREDRERRRRGRRERGKKKQSNNEEQDRRTRRTDPPTHHRRARAWPTDTTRHTSAPRIPPQRHMRNKSRPTANDVGKKELLIKRGAINATKGHSSFSTRHMRNAIGSIQDRPMRGAQANQWRLKNRWITNPIKKRSPRG